MDRITYMASRLLMPRATRLLNQQFATPLLRTTLQRRFVSHEPPKLTGAMDNAFNRERLAVKQHAAQSAGMHLCSVG